MKKLLSIFILLLAISLTSCKDTTNNTTSGENLQKNSSKIVSYEEVKTTTSTVIETKEKEQKMIITLTGDTNLASFYGEKLYFDTVFKDNGPTYFLKNLEHYFKNADVNITNLENVFTHSNTAIQGKIYTYKAYSDDYLDILTANNIMYVNVVNNHMQDYLQEGFDDTLELLKSKNIKYFGTNLVDTSDPEIGSVKVHQVETFQKGDIKLGLIGYYAFVLSYPSDETIQQDIENLRSQGCNFIIVSMHGGGQDSNKLDYMQETMARKFIDFGADMVYGHHPHAIQKVEEYNGKIIYYSLGNFFFVNYRDSKNPEGLLVELTLNMDEEGIITPQYKNVPIFWLGGYTQTYTPIEITDQEVINKVNNMLAGSIYVE